MTELKVKTHTVYTYETSDGREFDDKPEAEFWQKSLNVFNTIPMLDSDFKPTKQADLADYIHIKTWEQLEAFSTIQIYEGIDARIEQPGYYYYDGYLDKYINIDIELKKLQDIIKSVNALESEISK
jgi:hypothetical protein